MQCKPQSYIMNGVEVTRGKGSLDHSIMIKLQGMVDQVGTSKKFEGQNARVQDAKPPGGGERKELSSSSFEASTRDKNGPERIPIKIVIQVIIHVSTTKETGQHNRLMHSA